MYGKKPQITQITTEVGEDKFGNEYHRKWHKENQKKVAKIQKRWRDGNPNYYSNYMRERKGVSEDLIFQFLDNGFGNGTMEDFITFLQAEGVPEKHIGWFKVDVQKELKKRGGMS